MTRKLIRAGLSAEVISTGSNCWAAAVRISPWAHLELTNVFGEGWAWAIYYEREEVVAGYWPGAGTRAAARQAVRLVKAMGILVA
ncbi:hypothetical protein ACWF94_16415 [Streptomyces sp. NPDC055078]